jgi:predicted nucleic acid-binding protein
VKLAIYLDTSVISAYFDDAHPDRQTLTKEFWKIVPKFHVCISDLTQGELEQTNDTKLRTAMLNLANPFRMLNAASETLDLARSYIAKGIFHPREIADAHHVAIAVCHGCQILVSWNFKHIVNRRPRQWVNLVNTEMGYPPIELLSPPEV